MDAKILAKALAFRLQNTVPTIVSDEQTGFVKWCQLSLHVAIFGLPEDHYRFTSKQLHILAFTSLARHHLLLHWKSTKAPSSTQWLNDTISFLELGKFSYSVKGNSDKFYKEWLPFLTFFNSIWTLLPA